MSSTVHQLEISARALPTWHAGAKTQVRTQDWRSPGHTASFGKSPESNTDSLLLSLLRHRHSLPLEGLFKEKRSEFFPNLIITLPTTNLNFPKLLVLHRRRLKPRNKNKMSFPPLCSGHALGSQASLAFPNSLTTAGSPWTRTIFSELLKYSVPKHSRQSKLQSPGLVP